MLSQRKRFSYNVDLTASSYHQTHQKSSIVPEKSNYLSQTSSKSNVIQQKILQLQEQNKQIINETTKQFKKLEADVQRVEKILEEKEQTLIEMKKQKRQLSDNLENNQEESKILVQALNQKDLVIRQYQLKIQEMMKGNQQTESLQSENYLKIEEQIQTQQLNFFDRLSLDVATNKKDEIFIELEKVKKELLEAKMQLQNITQKFETEKQSQQEHDSSFQE